jgi:enterochelin esterase-like enzyme
VPGVESKYRVMPGRDHRAIAGLSMGGGQSLRIGFAHLDKFSSVAAFSAAATRSALPTVCTITRSGGSTSRNWRRCCFDSAR